MLEAAIIKYIIQCEATTNLRAGRVVGWTLGHFMREYKVPRTTLYRAINDCIDQGVIVRTSHAHYALSNEIRIACNVIPDSELVKS